MRQRLVKSEHDLRREYTIDESAAALKTLQVLLGNVYATRFARFCGSSYIY